MLMFAATAGPAERVFFFISKKKKKGMECFSQWWIFLMISNWVSLNTHVHCGRQTCQECLALVRRLCCQLAQTLNAMQKRFVQSPPPSRVFTKYFLKYSWHNMMQTGLKVVFTSRVDNRQFNSELELISLMTIGRLILRRSTTVCRCSHVLINLQARFKSTGNTALWLYGRLVVTDMLQKTDIAAHLFPRTHTCTRAC